MTPNTTHQFNIAVEDLTVENGTYTPAQKDDEIVIEEGGIYVTTQESELNSPGSYYTPGFIVEYIGKTAIGNNKIVVEDGDIHVLPSNGELPTSSLYYTPGYIKEYVKSEVGR